MLSSCPQTRKERESRGRRRASFSFVVCSGQSLLSLLLLFLCITIYNTSDCHAEPSEFFINVKDFGAKGDGVADETFAIRSALQRAATLQPSDTDMVTVYFPPGNYLTWPFNITSNTVLYIDTDATVVANDDPSGWVRVAEWPSHGPGRPKKGFIYTPFIGAFNQSNIHITGGGRIEGQGRRWWKEDKDNNTRGRLVEFQSCEDITVENITLLNSPFWTLHLQYSNNIVVRYVNIYSPFFSQNTDGIDIDSSSNVFISNCNIHCGDDNISIKSGFDMPGIIYGRPSTNITIKDCDFEYGQGLSIGSEASGGVSNVLLSNLRFSLTTSAVYIKTARGRGGIIENIIFENLVFDRVLRPIFVNMFYVDRKPSKDKITIPIVRNIIVRNVKGVAIQAGKIACLPESPCSGIEFYNIEIVSLLPFSWSSVKNCTSDLTSPSIMFDKELHGFGLFYYYLSETSNAFGLLVLLVVLIGVACRYVVTIANRKKRRKRREGAVLTPPAAFVRLSFDGLGTKADKVV